MALIKKKSIQSLKIDFRNGRLTLTGLVKIIDDETGVIEAERGREFQIKARDNAKAEQLGIGAVATRIWDYLGV